MSGPPDYPDRGTVRLLVVLVIVMSAVAAFAVGGLIAVSGVRVSWGGRRRRLGGGAAGSHRQPRRGRRPGAGDAAAVGHRGAVGADTGSADVDDTIRSDQASGVRRRLPRAGDPDPAAQLHGPTRRGRRGGWGRS
ncbi:hypothetical protein [Candidatus Frankia alpina]|uniref:hypothetical protein n=1 Tax=Candidatus Frankia alpina TaxID=2699483 RepID=UPI001F25504F|nr:hypothetical protein [Candidatus Frankia alpina]